MRLDYTVLCIDDNIGTLRDTKKALRNHNNKVGILTEFLDTKVEQAARETDIDKFKQRIFADISVKFKNYSIDLVIVDLHLGELKGHEIIDHIRETQTMYRPIVFYSGGEPKNEQTALQQLQDGLTKNDLVGKSVFVSVRGKDLIDNLRGICSEMHVEEHKLNASRGLLMDRTSEIDAKILDHLRKKETWASSDPAKQEKIKKIVEKELKSLRKNAFKGACKTRAQHEGGFELFVKWICESPEIDVAYGIDAFSRNNLIRELMRISDKTKAAGETHSDYFKGNKTPPHLNNIRNVYAHQTEKKIGEEHNEERCKYIREEVRRHLENVEAVTSNK